MDRTSSEHRTGDGRRSGYREPHELPVDDPIRSSNLPGGTMILSTRPDTPGASYVLSEAAPPFSARGSGALSLKSFYHGAAHYAVAGGRFRVNDDCYLLLNDGQPYEIEIDAGHPVDAFCLFFQPDFAGAVHRSLAERSEILLDDPFRTRGPIHFFERTYRHDNLLSPALFRLRAALRERRDEPGWLEEQLHLIMQRMLQVHGKAFREMEAVPAVRAATREELYRRLHLARDYIHAACAEPITLDDIARVAALSLNHLLRTFRKLFGCTPHQLLIAQRLERARRLLVETDLSVTAICLATGYQSPGTFSTRFRRRFGLSPEAFRRQAQSCR